MLHIVVSFAYSYDMLTNRAVASPCLSKANPVIDNASPAPTADHSKVSDYKIQGLTNTASKPPERSHPLQSTIAFSRRCEEFIIDQGLPLRCVDECC